MKRLKKSLIFLATLISINLCYAGEESKESEPNVKTLNEIHLESINFEELAKATTVGSLADYVKDAETPLDSFLERIKRKLHLQPNDEYVAFVNGQLCHIGYYPRSIIYTVLQGPYYGLQTTTTCTGVVLYVNYDYDIEYTSYGVILHHYYDDSEVVTGANQLITFYK